MRNALLLLELRLSVCLWKTLVGRHSPKPFVAVAIKFCYLVRVGCLPFQSEMTSPTTSGELQSQFIVCSPADAGHRWIDKNIQVIAYSDFQIYISTLFYIDMSDLQLERRSAFRQIPPIGGSSCQCSVPFARLKDFARRTFWLDLDDRNPRTRAKSNQKSLSSFVVY